MAYNQEWPYTDPNRYNSDWELAQVKENRQRMDVLEANQKLFETTINNKVAAQDNKIAAQDAKITAQDNKIAAQDAKITAQDNKIAAQDTKIDNFISSVTQQVSDLVASQVPGAVQDYLNTLSPSYDEITNRVNKMWYTSHFTRRVVGRQVYWLNCDPAINETEARAAVVRLGGGVTQYIEIPTHTQFTSTLAEINSIIEPISIQHPLSLFIITDALNSMAINSGSYAYNYTQNAANVIKKDTETLYNIRLRDRCDIYYGIRIIDNIPIDDNWVIGALYEKYRRLNAFKTYVTTDVYLTSAAAIANGYIFAPSTDMSEYAIKPTDGSRVLFNTDMYHVEWIVPANNSLSYRVTELWTPIYVETVGWSSTGEAHGVRIEPNPNNNGLIVTSSVSHTVPIRTAEIGLLYT